MKLLTPNDYLRYEEFLQGHKKGHFLQSPSWSKIKSMWNYEVLLAEDAHGNIKGSMAVLIRRLPIPILKITLMYSPRGPVCDIHDKETINELVSSAKELAKKYKSYVLKIDPDVDVREKEFSDILKEIGFRMQKQTKNFEGIQPRFVFRLDISGKTEQEVAAMFQSKTRYNIRLAGRKGVECKIGSRSDLARFHEIMLETGQRDEFITRSLGYFQNMYDNMGEHLRLYTAYYEGQMVAGTIAIWYGNKVWYVYGASSNKHRDVMPNYVLQWEMISWAIEKGCDIYDFRGVSGDLDPSNPLYGLYRFKKGFNGEFTEFLGEFDYVFKPLIYALVEKGGKLYKNIRHKRLVANKAK